MAARNTVSVQVYGLRDFQRALLVLDKRLPDVVDEAAKEAAEIVAQGARKQWPVGPARNGHAKDSIKATRKGQGWSVEAYGPRFPYGPWIDFGGTINKHTSKPTRRPYFKTGRFVYPSYERHRNGINRIMDVAIRRHAELAGLDVD